MFFLLPSWMCFCGFAGGDGYLILVWFLFDENTRGQCLSFVTPLFPSAGFDACVFLCVCLVCVCMHMLLFVLYFVWKSSPLSVMDDTDLHSDRQEGRQAASLWWSPGRMLCTPCPLFYPLFLFGWAQGCRLMKRAWTTENSDSHLADTSAHLQPSARSLHDSRAPPIQISLPASALFPLGHTTLCGCPVATKHSSPSVASDKGK